MEIQISEYPNGELKVIEDNIDASHVLVLFPQVRNINLRLMEFFLMLKLCQECKIIDTFIPYIPYSRQDNSISFQLILDIIKFLKVRYIIALDLHKPAFNNSIINILPHELYGEKFKGQDLIVVAPDVGAQNRAAAFANYLKTELVVIDKRNNSVQNLAAVYNKDCLIIDDIIDSGKTLINAINILKNAGAKHIRYCITHNFRRYED